MLIPESGKPADVNLSDVQTFEDANRLLIWLQTVLLDMERQVNDRGLEDRDWLKKLRAAERNTNNLRHRLLEKRDRDMPGSATLAEAVSTVVVESLPEEAVIEVQKAVGKRFPHLAGLDILALKE